MDAEKKLKQIEGVLLKVYIEGVLTESDAIKQIEGIVLKEESETDD